MRVLCLFSPLIFPTLSFPCLIKNLGQTCSFGLESMVSLVCLSTLFSDSQPKSRYSGRCGNPISPFVKLRFRCIDSVTGHPLQGNKGERNQ